MSDDPRTYTKTFFVFSARKNFFEFFSSHYSRKIWGHVEHMEMTGIVRCIEWSNRLGAQTPASWRLAPPKARLLFQVFGKPKMGDQNLFGDSVKAKNPCALGTGPGKIAALAASVGPQKQNLHRFVVLRTSRGAAGVPTIWKR